MIRIGVILTQFCMLAVLAVHPEPATATDSEPSKEETQRFIKEKLAGTVEYESDIHSHAYSFEDCVFLDNWTSSNNPKAYGGRRGIYSVATTRVPLQSMDPTRVAESREEVCLNATADRNVISVEARGRSVIGALNGEPMERLETEQLPSDCFAALGKREAQQLVRAFTHLITICGGKRELF